MERDFVTEPRIPSPRPHRSLRRAQHAGDRRGQAIPVRALLVELRATETRERIEARVAAGVGRRPRRAKPAALLETMQRRVERSLLYLHDVAGHLLQPPRDGVAVDRTERDDFQDQHVERALQDVGFRGVGHHTKTLYTSICRTSRCRPPPPARLERVRPPRSISPARVLSL